MINHVKGNVGFPASPTNGIWGQSQNTKISEIISNNCHELGEGFLFRSKLSEKF